MTNNEVREFMQEHRIHFKNRMAMEAVGDALIAFLAKRSTPTNTLQAPTYRPPNPDRTEWSKQDSETLKKYGKDPLL